MTTDNSPYAVTVVNEQAGESQNSMFSGSIRCRSRHFAATVMSAIVCSIAGGTVYLIAR